VCVRRRINTVARHPPQPRLCRTPGADSGVAFPVGAVCSGFTASFHLMFGSDVYACRTIFATAFTLVQAAAPKQQRIHACLRVHLRVHVYLCERHDVSAKLLAMPRLASPCREFPCGSCASESSTSTS
jgi:hypothetical protein